MKFLSENSAIVLTALFTVACAQIVDVSPQPIFQTDPILPTTPATLGEINATSPITNLNSVPLAGDPFLPYNYRPPGEFTLPVGGAFGGVGGYGGGYGGSSCGSCGVRPPIIPPPIIPCPPPVIVQSCPCPVVSSCGGGCGGGYGGYGGGIGGYGGGYGGYGGGIGGYGGGYGGYGGGIGGYGGGYGGYGRY